MMTTITALYGVMLFVFGTISLILLGLLCYSIKEISYALTAPGALAIELAAKLLNETK